MQWQLLETDGHSNVMGSCCCRRSNRKLTFLKCLGCWKPPWQEQKTYRSWTLNGKWAVYKPGSNCFFQSWKKKKEKKSGTIIQYGMNKRVTNHLRAFGLYRRRFFFFIWNSLHWRAETMTIEISLLWRLSKCSCIQESVICLQSKKLRQNKANLIYIFC